MGGGTLNVGTSEINPKGKIETTMLIKTIKGMRILKFWPGDQEWANTPESLMLSKFRSTAFLKF